MNWKNALLAMAFLIGGFSLLQSQWARHTAGLELFGPTTDRALVQFETRIVQFRAPIQLRAGLGLGPVQHVHDEYTSERVGVVPRLDLLWGKRRHFLVAGLHAVIPAEEHAWVLPHLGYKYLHQSGICFGGQIYPVRVVDFYLPVPGLFMGYNFGR